jgi:hypothetical protein
MVNLEHLQPATRILAMQSANKRLASLNVEHWIGYSRAQQILAQLESLIATEPNKLRPQNLLIVGPSNNGKTMIAEKFFRAHPAGMSANKECENIPVLKIQMPAAATVSKMYTAFMMALGAPVGLNGRHDFREMLTLKLIRDVGVRMLIIDEIHNLLSANAQWQREVLNFLRFLGNELRIPIVGMGMRDAYLVIRSDDQLENRFHPMLLPLWEYSEEFVRLIASFESILPLRESSNLAALPLCEVILRRSEGTIGEIASLLNNATRATIQRGEKRICIATLEQESVYQSPSLRRRLIEKELR